MKADLKAEIIKLLKEDEEFRYTVAGILGYDEILKRMDKHTEAIEKLQRQVAELQKQVAEHSKAIHELQKQVVELQKEVREL